MRTVRFGDVASRLNIHVDQDNTNLEYYVGGEHIDSREFLITKKAPIKGSTIGYQFQFGFREGDILFMTKNPHLRKCSLVEFDGLCSIATFVIHSNDENILLQKYLLLEMQTDRFWEYCEAHKSGGVNYFITWGTLSNYIFDIPDIDIQKKSADKAWAAYELKLSYRDMIKATDEMLKSQFIEMFWGGKYTMKKLRGHIEVLRGVSYKPSDVHEDLSDNTSIVLRSNNIDGGQVNFDDLVYVDSERVSEHQVLNAGDIVMCGSNGSKKLVGKAALLNETPRENTSFGAFCLGIRCKSSIIPEYLATYFQTSLYRDKIEALGSGSNILNIKPDHIYDLEIPIPSLGEQETFVSIVKQADKSKFMRSKSQFIEMFGGNKVDYVQLSSLCSTFIDGDWIESKDQSESGIRLIQTGNVGCGEYKDKGDKAKYITEDTFNKLHCTEIYPGDILISRLPDPVGRACVLPEGLGKCVTAVDCTIIRFSEKILPNFFVAYTNTPEYLTQIKSTLAGTTRLRVSRGNLGKVKIPVPSIEQQRTFVSIAEQADKSKLIGLLWKHCHCRDVYTK